jgi:hypothetical protein
MAASIPDVAPPNRSISSRAVVTNVMNAGWPGKVKPATVIGGPAFILW